MDAPTKTDTAPNSPATSTQHLAPTSISDQRFTVREESILRQKLDRHIIPVVYTLYALAFLDRSNIGNAYAAGMKTDLNLTSSKYEWLLTIFYISYIIFQLFVIFWKVLPPRVIASFTALAWGVTSMLQGTAHTWSGLMTARFFIGAFEASFGPGVALYFSFFYPRYEFGSRFGIFVSAAALSSSFAGALAYGLVQIGKGSRVASWRLLFIVEGAPTVLYAPFIYYLLPNSIETCKFLTPREKSLARLRMSLSNTVQGDHIRAEAGGEGGIAWSQVLASLRDPINYVNGVLFFIANVTFASLPVYLPTLLKEAGFSTVRAQGLSAPPYLAAFICAILSMFVSDRLGKRGMMVSFYSAVGAIGYVVLAICRGVWIRYAAIFLVATGCFTMVPLLYSWVSNNQVRESQRGAGFAIFGVLGQCGPLLGIHLYPSRHAPYYVTGMWIAAGLLFLASLLSFSLSLYFQSLNNRRDTLYGPSKVANSTLTTQTAWKSEESGEDVFVNEELLREAASGEDWPHFRYVT
ncbi:major facilitator superfamily domain-containing protein [Cantharellus anzutake]|uniref:major facilitator superfamily domain-containing protein n=1 Tax=Cantharellus anzutake TaxID=1750568 RepID=UPI001908899F|nr:major facilitator superfamily domain-containing protein [Cantharellus anzutake]KAF8319816.1 major facilitator superfamily domain-containing protein [Cantharellus anzutake]